MALVDLGNKITLKPNNSLSTEGQLKLIVFLLLIVLIVTLSFVNIGAWLVLPFAGLEFIAFLYAFHVIYLHSEDYETIYIDDENVCVERKNNQALSSVSFKRYWANVTLREVETGNHFFAKKALFVGSHGKEVEIGKGLMSDAQRSELALVLKQKIKNVN